MRIVLIDGHFSRVKCKLNGHFREVNMTGKEAWSLIAPIIAPHGGVNDDGKISLLDEAYVTTFSALKYWDERHKENDDD